MNWIGAECLEVFGSVWSVWLSGAENREMEHSGVFASGAEQSKR